MERSGQLSPCEAAGAERLGPLLFRPSIGHRRRKHPLVQVVDQELDEEAVL